MVYTIGQVAGLARVTVRTLQQLHPPPQGREQGRSQDLP